MRDETDDRSRFRASRKSDAGDTRGAARGAEQTGEYAKQRRLPCSVRSEEREAFSISHRERESADCYATTERAREIGRLDGGRV